MFDLHGLTTFVSLYMLYPSRTEPMLSCWPASLTLVKCWLHLWRNSGWMSPPKTLYDNGVTQHHIIPPLHCNFSSTCPCSWCSPCSWWTYVCFTANLLYTLYTSFPVGREVSLPLCCSGTKYHMYEIVSLSIQVWPRWEDVCKWNASLVMCTLDALHVCWDWGIAGMLKMTCALCPVRHLPVL